MRAATFFIFAGLTLVSAGTRADDAPPQSKQFVGHAQAAFAAVRARVSGNVKQVAVKAGDVVAKGDLLIEIDLPSYQLDWQAAIARMKAAEAEFEVARINAENARKLQGSKVASPEQLALSEAEKAKAKANLSLAKVEMERVQLKRSWARVTAPIDGRVGRIQATVGDFVSAESPPLLCVVATDQLSVAFNVPEQMYLQWRRDGLDDPAKLNVNVGFAGEEGHPHQATMESIEPEVNSRTGNVQFKAAVPNPDGLFLPGMSARVLVTSASP